MKALRLRERKGYRLEMPTATHALARHKMQSMRLVALIQGVVLILLVPRVHSQLCNLQNNSEPNTANLSITCITSFLKLVNLHIDLKYH